MKWRFPTKIENIPTNSEDMETRKKYHPSGQRESYAQYTKKGIVNNVITIEEYPY
jgi:hypothetical protein